MPAHIYIRTGDYLEGTLANERAVKADNAYITQCRRQGIYPPAYVPPDWFFPVRHNLGRCCWRPDVQLDASRMW